jgi:hypothetical protein
MYSVSTVSDACQKFSLQDAKCVVLFPNNDRLFFPIFIERRNSFPAEVLLYENDDNGYWTLARPLQTVAAIVEYVEATAIPPAKLPPRRSRHKKKPTNSFCCVDIND